MCLEMKEKISVTTSPFMILVQLAKKNGEKISMRRVAFTAEHSTGNVKIVRDKAPYTIHVPSV